MTKLRERYEYQIKWQGLLPIIDSVKSNKK
jgi:hypothetical protein